MEAISNRIQANTAGNVSRNPVIDTTFVLFFLAVDLGQNIGVMVLDTLVMAAALIAVAVLPYFLTTERIDFGKWLFGRASIAIFALLLGQMFKQSLGVVFPETFSFLPLTLLIVTAMVSC